MASLFVGTPCSENTLFREGNLPFPRDQGSGRLSESGCSDELCMAHWKPLSKDGEKVCQAQGTETYSGSKNEKLRQTAGLGSGSLCNTSRASDQDAGALGGFESEWRSWASVLGSPTDSRLGSWAEEWRQMEGAMTLLQGRKGRFWAVAGQGTEHQRWLQQAQGLGHRKDLS